MADKQIITISREYGSGGREIGLKLAEKLGILFVDKDMLDARLRGEDFNPNDLIIKMKEARKGIVSNVYAALGFASPSETKDFEVESKMIREIAEEQSCVVVGRCADYILSDMPEVTSIFIYGRLEDKVKRAMRTHNISEDEARIWIVTTDSQRKGMYNRQTGRIWGEALNYDLSLDSGSIESDDIVDFIISYVELRKKAENQME